MEIKDEYKRLLNLLEESEKGADQINLEEILKQAVAFFEALREVFPQAPKEQREELTEMMTTLHSKLQEISKHAAKESGMSEEELASYSENPSNFTPEQWKMVQESRQKLYDSARRFSSSIGEGKAPRGGAGPKKKTAKTARRPKRSQWKKT